MTAPTTRLIDLTVADLEAIIERRVRAIVGAAQERAVVVPGDGWLRRSHAAKLLGCDPSTLWRQVLDGSVPQEAIQHLPSGEVRYSAAWVLARRAA